MRAPSALALSAVAATGGCGRYNIDSVPAPVPELDAPADSPPVPAVVCGTSQIALDPVAAPADLAVAGDARGFTALWTDATRAGVSAVRLDVDHVPRSGPTTVIAQPISAVGGLSDAGDVLVAATEAAGMQTLWALDRDLAHPVAVRTEPRMLGRGPFGASGAVRVWFRGDGATGRVEMTYVRSDGSLFNSGTYSAGSLAAVGGAEGPGHAHVLWSVAPAHCFISDVNLPPEGPALSSPFDIATDCYEPRTVSGPLTADSLLVVWTTAAGAVRMRYVGAAITPFDGAVVATGHAPRVEFDGSMFWIAWRDRDGLAIARVSQVGATEVIGLPGWEPAGDEAFELIRRGTQVELAILGTDRLSLLALCSK